MTVTARCLGNDIVLYAPGDWTHMNGNKGPPSVVLQSDMQVTHNYTRKYVINHQLNRSGAQI